ncbi:DUF4333 domain-containing protein [Ruania halotolerans]|uniref:DUF4333 domain-containing protein n=1 Tax=Ruania halotolerans TaxID=2897773 RepID=UPI001E63B5DD|nr:DUF4333 domain-containing protein [Ruania halotolerans]UFU06499.1 DUF4333 domain-containing protein [Ruania halotolerans]
MQQMNRRIVKASVIPAMAALLLVGCSGANAVAQSEVEEVTADQLEAMVGGTRPTIDCPDDLDAEVDTTMDCVLSVDGDEDTYLVTLTVTSVEDGNVNWDVQVAETPM